MRAMRNHNTAVAVCIFLSGIVRLIAWSPPHPQCLYSRSCLREPRLRRPPSSTILAGADDEGGPSGGGGHVEKGGGINEGMNTAVIYGVSYIGGDPCGSKYNDDPFDVDTNDSQKFRPGLPDDMKDRIAALARRKMSEEPPEES